MKSLTIALSIIAGAGCSDTRPSPSPTPVSVAQSTPPTPEPPAQPPPPPDAINQVRIVSGWDDAPTANATVRIDGVARSVGGDGRVTDVRDLRGRTLEIETRGFLPRRTRIVSDTVTLWPAAGAREAEAIKQLAFYRPDGRAPWLVALNIRAVVSLDGLFSPDERIAFEGAAERLNELMGERRFAIVGTPAMATTIPGAASWHVGIGDTSVCPMASTPLWGLCLPYLWFRGEPNDSQALVVTRDAMNRLGTPMRLLALANFVGSNPLPGLLTAEHGKETELSLLEQQALRMLSQRQNCTQFPDDDYTLGC